MACPAPRREQSFLTYSIVYDVNEFQYDLDLMEFYVKTSCRERNILIELGWGTKDPMHRYLCIGNRKGLKIVINYKWSPLQISGENYWIGNNWILEFSFCSSTTRQQILVNLTSWWLIHWILREILHSCTLLPNVISDWQSEVERTGRDFSGHHMKQDQESEIYLSKKNAT